MFITKSKYNALCDKCMRLENEKHSFVNPAEIALVKADKKISELTAELEKYKQLYADELEKRLNLLEKIQSKEQ